MDIFQENILLIDDEVELLLLMETVLKKEGFNNIYKAKNGEEGIRQFEKINFGIVVLDIMMPGIDGFEVCKNIRKNSFVPIIFLSAKSEEFDKYYGFKLGADDYITKPFSPQEVALRVIANLKRNNFAKNTIMKNEILKVNDIEVNVTKGQVIRRGESIQLTAREFNLLVYMLRNHDCVLSKNIISLNVWGADFEGFDNTIMVHIRKLREKLENDPSNPLIIKTVKGLGYILCLGE